MVNSSKSRRGSRKSTPRTTPSPGQSSWEKVNSDWDSKSDRSLELPAFPDTTERYFYDGNGSFFMDSDDGFTVDSEAFTPPTVQSKTKKGSARSRSEGSNGRVYTPESDLAEKKEDVERQVLGQWIASFTGVAIPVKTEKEFLRELEDGVILCLILEQIQWLPTHIARSLNVANDRRELPLEKKRENLAFFHKALLQNHCILENQFPRSLEDFTMDKILPSLLELMEIAEITYVELRDAEQQTQLDDSEMEEREVVSAGEDPLQDISSLDNGLNSRKRGVSSSSQKKKKPIKSKKDRPNSRVGEETNERSQPKKCTNEGSEDQKPTKKRSGSTLSEKNKKSSVKRERSGSKAENRSSKSTDKKKGAEAELIVDKNSRSNKTNVNSGRERSESGTSGKRRKSSSNKPDDIEKALELVKTKDVAAEDVPCSTTNNTETKDAQALPKLEKSSEDLSSNDESGTSLNGEVDGTTAEDGSEILKSTKVRDKIQAILREEIQKQHLERATPKARHYKTKTASETKKIDEALNSICALFIFVCICLFAFAFVFDLLGVTDIGIAYVLGVRRTNRYQQDLSWYTDMRMPW